MRYKNPIDLQCPFCNYKVKTDKDFAAKNGRVFCTTCCKAFDVKVRTEDQEEEHPAWYRKHILMQDTEETEEDLEDSDLYHDDDDGVPF
jgi:uncharacterized Zn finger protein (UPF0148 family)